MCQVVSKTLVVIFNLILAVFSAILIVLGAFIKWAQQTLLNKISSVLHELNLDQNAQDAANELAVLLLRGLTNFGLVMFILGVFLLVLSICGICGVCCRNKVLLGVYAALLLVCLVALLIFTIVVGVHKNSFKQKVGEVLKNYIIANYEMDNERPPNTGATVLINTLQRQKKCCGSFNYRDFHENESFKRQNDKIPYSCCKVESDKNCWANPTSSNSYMQFGCYEAVTDSKLMDYFMYSLIALVLLIFIISAITIYLVVRFARDELKVV